jgi:tRNA threonylcarbamoyladenosine biosynthesis protein TsaE
MGKSKRRGPPLQGSEQPATQALVVVTIAHPPILESRQLHWANEADCAATAAALATRPALHDAFVQLHGPLGAGKTTFVRHLLRALGVQGRVKSPTYALLEPYQSGTLAIAHMDFYRFGAAREFDDAGLRDVLTAPGLKLAEWPDQAGALLPAPDLCLHIQPDARGSDEGARRVHLHAHSTRGQALLP